NNTPAPTANNQSFCISEEKTIGDLVVVGNNIKWYASATAVDVLDESTVLESGSYFASQTLNNCESVTRKEVVVTINNTPAPTANSVQEFCSNTNPKIINLA